MESVLVTGGMGFIGSHLIEELLRKGIRVTVIDDLSNGSKENLQDVWGNIEFIHADISKIGLNIKGSFDVIFHLAAHNALFFFILLFEIISLAFKKHFLIDS